MEYGRGWNVQELYLQFKIWKTRQGDQTHRFSDFATQQNCLGVSQKTDPGSAPRVLIPLVWGAAWSLQGILKCSQVWELLVQRKVHSAAPRNDDDRSFPLLSIADRSLLPPTLPHQLILQNKTKYMTPSGQTKLKTFFVSYHHGISQRFEYSNLHFQSSRGCREGNTTYIDWDWIWIIFFNWSLFL